MCKSYKGGVADLFVWTILCHRCMCIEVMQELVDGADLAKEEWMIEVVQRLVECAILIKEEWLTCSSGQFCVTIVCALKLCRKIGARCKIC